MKILYGVQGTGNGHITRARALNRYFAQYGLEVDYLFSGREPSKYFDMQEFGTQPMFRQGLSFTHQAGEVKVLQTLRNNSLSQLIKDIRNLNLSRYDLVITDFEPITAWAAKCQKVPCIGIGHQYAFQHQVPVDGANWFARKIMRSFAPTERSLGLHWHHFGAPILPPIAEIQQQPELIDGKKIVVYLGFEEAEEVIQFLEPFTTHLFVIYGPFSSYQSFGNIQLKPLSREGFCRDLGSCNGVISNAGFELASESIQLGKKLLVKPLNGQMEQLSNAKALKELGLGMSMSTLDGPTLRHWLETFEGKKRTYPDVANAIVKWLASGQWDDVATLASDLWGETDRLSASVQPLAKARKRAAA